MKQETNVGKEEESKKYNHFDPNKWMFRFIILFALLEVVLMIAGLVVFWYVRVYAIKAIEQWWLTS